MSQFSFPVLDHDDLVQCLEEMEMSVDSNQLAKPTYELVRPLLEQIVVLLTGTTRWVQRAPHRSSASVATLLLHPLTDTRTLVSAGKR